jgi:tRNA (guanine37-N1)-methyltransferase
MLTIDIITLFPDFFTTPLQASILGRAIKEGQAVVNVHDLRPFGLGKHQVTDDRPYGGGAGMVMLVEPIAAALESLHYQKGTPHQKIILTSAKGQRWQQTTAREYAQLEKVCIICGHYEGVDERVAEHLVDAEMRLGDFVMTGGEPAALAMTDSLVRLLPGTLGNADSLTGESHDTQPGEGSHPQYGRPQTWQGYSVPPVLLTGNHPVIADWRQQQRRQLDK